MLFDPAVRYLHEPPVFYHSISGKMRGAAHRHIPSHKFGKIRNPSFISKIADRTAFTPAASTVQPIFRTKHLRNDVTVYQG